MSQHFINFQEREKKNRNKVQTHWAEIRKLIDKLNEVHWLSNDIVSILEDVEDTGRNKEKE